MFHIICVLLGYLMFQIYVGTEEGEEIREKIVACDTQKLGIRKAERKRVRNL
jgi:hypothetical protein